MTGLKKGTGSLDFDSDEDDAEDDTPSESTPASEDDDESSLQEEDTSSTRETASQAPDLDVDDLPYLVQRQMRGASVNADRTNQLLLEVRPFVKADEDTFLADLQDLIDGPVYKGDAREAALVVAQEHPELVAEKLTEWGIEYLDK